MSSFFQKARERAQEAAAQFQQQHSSEAPEGASHRTSFTYPGSIPHMLRHGMASVDPRHEYNRSFHLLSGKIKAMRIDHDTLARGTRGVATATCRWGQDQLPEKREDGTGDEALADMTDRLAYIFSLVADLQAEHAKRVEESRADLKRVQKAEMELAPKRAARVKIHKELITLLPERAKVTSTKIAPLEAQLEALEADDKELEEDLGKLKRDALKSSYDAHFDSMIELGEKMALLARYGKLINTQLPIYAPPFPTPHHLARDAGEPSWQGEATIAAIRAAVEPALLDFKPDYSLPDLPDMSRSTSLTKRQTVRYGESHKQELEKVLKEEEDGSGAVDSQDSTLQSFKGSPTILPMGGSLPPNLNLGPSPLPARSGLGTSAPEVAPGSAQYHDDAQAPVSPRNEGLSANPASVGIAEGGPTLAETGSPIMSTSQGPGPLTGTLSPRVKSPPAAKATVAHPSTAHQSSQGVPLGQTYPTSEEEKRAQEQHEVANTTVAARIRRDGTVVRKGDADWKSAQEEDLPAYHE